MNWEKNRVNYRVTYTMCSLSDMNKTRCQIIIEIIIIDASIDINVYLTNFKFIFASTYIYLNVWNLK